MVLSRTWMLALTLTVASACSSVEPHSASFTRYFEGYRAPGAKMVKGESCRTTWFYIFRSGEASMHTALRKAMRQSETPRHKLAYMTTDIRNSGFLFFYSKHCTVVRAHFRPVEGESNGDSQTTSAPERAKRGSNKPQASQPSSILSESESASDKSKVEKTRSEPSSARSSDDSSASSADDSTSTTQAIQLTSDNPPSRRIERLKQWQWSQVSAELEGEEFVEGELIAVNSERIVLKLPDSSIRTLEMVKLKAVYQTPSE